jgi:predicted O-methyltransferase YrrM
MANEKQIHPFVDKRIEDYCKENTSPESEVLRYIDRETHLRFLRPKMISGNWQGNLLKILSLLVEPKNVLEIGTFTAYATLCLAEGLVKDGVVHTIERDILLEDFILETIEKFGYQDKIKLHMGNAMEVIDTIEGDFDMIFIDADKANYPAYLEKCISRLRSGGLIIADNIYQALCELDSTHQEDYQKRLDVLKQTIRQTDANIRTLLENADSTFLIYHPALSYFARDYGLKQVSIEEGGKEPSPAQLKALIETCRNENVHTIFVQQEFDQRNAQLIAHELGVNIVSINPLSYDWVKEMIRIAEALKH